MVVCVIYFNHQTVGYVDFGIAPLHELIVVEIHRVRIYPGTLKCVGILGV